MNLQVRPAPDERAGRACVVEVDVREQQRARGLAAQGVHERVRAGLRTRVDEHVADLPAADHALAAEVLYIDLAHKINLQSIK